MNNFIILSALFIALTSLGGCGGSGGSSPASDATTYTVGGTVSGLAGSGLVLANNGNEDVSIDADGSFQFGGEVNDGAAYAVTVSEQPHTPKQTCVVTNGTGTVSGTDVVDITVDCTTTTYSVSGTVTGLAGSGLILTNNAADELVISDDGSFQFATEIADASTYAVVVSAQPKSPNQTCLVSNGSGTIAGAAVTDVSVACSTDPAFGINGTVSGYLGGGTLSLEMNGEAITIGSDGMFSFPTPVFQGVAYNVSVVEHPTGPNQLCEVTNGSGVIADTVSDVTVTCETVNYTPSVSVPTLWGEGMVVTNASTGEAIEITSRNANDFAPQADGSNYSFTVTTQPSSPNQICDVRNGVGNISGSDVTLLADCEFQKYAVPITSKGATGSYAVTISELVVGSQLATTTSGVWSSGPASKSWDFSDGSIYEVSVESPQGQECTVSNNKGTINGADVPAANGVAIVCSGIMHSVGGTISGLTADGLVLTNNEQTLALSSGSSGYSFSVPDAASYDISVKTQPAGLRCDVTNGSGSNVTADITTASVSCAANAEPVPNAGPYNILNFSPNGHYLDATLSTGIDPSDTHTYTWEEVSDYGVEFVNNGSNNPDDTEIHYDFPDGVAVIKVEVKVTIDDGVYAPVTSDKADYFIYRDDYAYVTINGPGDGSAPDNSLGNINDAIAYAEANGRVAVAVQEGEYLVKSEEGTGTHVVVHEGVSLYGGYDNVTWLRDINANTTKIEDDYSRDRPFPVRAIEVGDTVTRETVIDGFKVDGGNYVNSSAIYIQGGSPTITNSYIYSNGGGGLRSAGIYMEGGSPWIENNTIYDTGKPSVSSETTISAGIYATDGASPVIVRNNISGGMAGVNSGIYIYDASAIIGNNTITGGKNASIHGHENLEVVRSYGIYLSQAPNVMILNNTINGGTTDNSYGIYLYSTHPVIQNNIIFTMGHKLSYAWGSGYCVAEFGEDADPAKFTNNFLACGRAYQDYDSGCYADGDSDDNDRTCTVTEANALLDMTTGANRGGDEYVYGLVDPDGPSDNYEDFQDNDWHLTGDYPFQATDGLCLWPSLGSDKDGIARTPSGFGSCAGQTGWSIGAYEYDSP